MLFPSILASSLCEQPSSYLVNAVNAIKHKMISEHCVLYQGRLRKIPKDVKYTYVKYESVKNYVLKSMEDTSLSDLLCGTWKQVRPKL